MELKPYQQEVIDDLARFLEIIQTTKNAADAFDKFWISHPKMPVDLRQEKVIDAYKNNVPRVPHVCVKVPTAGGKTFIACNALKTIFDAFNYKRQKAVVWLVPSTTILDQTIGHLKNNAHPYRQKINAHFANKVEVYDKQALLQGSSFNALSVQEQLSIFVLSFDSLRAKNKDDRKVYQENSNLQSFGQLVGQEEEISLMTVIQALNPVLIVDESHNAESDLSVEMLKNLNPSFILDLTATPRKNSNIISFVDTISLKKENMVKLPVIVSNHYDKLNVIHSAMQLRRKLQLLAEAEEKEGGRYIRPIVLFQAQPKNAADTTTFQKIKEILLGLGISEEEIKIKTASINEIKDVDLMSRECKVRYIITVNALKEGWDCPFAYILASVADKSSVVDVEQVLGRVLRQPYVIKHKHNMLNLCYVLTASAKFTEVLNNIVKALNHAGYSRKDFKATNEPWYEPAEYESLVDLQTVPDEWMQDTDIAGMSERRYVASEVNGDPRIITEIMEMAQKEEESWDEMLMEMETMKHVPVPPDLKPFVKTYPVKTAFAEAVSDIFLPQFYIRKMSGEIFNEPEQKLNKEDLLEGFELSKADSTISFNDVSSLYKIDLDDTTNDHTPSFVKIEGKDKELLSAYLLSASTEASRVKNFTHLAMRQMKDMDSIDELEIKKYLARIFENFTDAQFTDLLENSHDYVRKIKEKIQQLSENYAEKLFRDYIDTDRIFIKPVYEFPKAIIPGAVSKPIAGSLYEAEAEMNGLEEKMIIGIAALHNVLFWTRNIERRQFRINGFINHYPDFIIHTKNNKTILLEVKGDDRDNSNSETKLKLGKAWEKSAGNGFKYFMVFDRSPIDGAHRFDDFLKLMREL